MAALPLRLLLSLDRGSSKCRPQRHRLGRLLLPGKPPEKGTQLLSGAGRSPGMGSAPCSGAKIKEARILLAPVPATCNKCLESLLSPQLGQKALGAPHSQAHLHCGYHISPFSPKNPIGDCIERFLIQVLEGLHVCVSPRQQTWSLSLFVGQERSKICVFRSLSASQTIKKSPEDLSAASSGQCSIPHPQGSPSQEESSLCPP